MRRGAPRRRCTTTADLRCAAAALHAAAHHHERLSKVCMSCTPPSACAAPVRHSSRCSPLSSRRHASVMLVAPRSCNSQPAGGRDTGANGTQPGRARQIERHAVATAAVWRHVQCVQRTWCVRSGVAGARAAKSGQCAALACQECAEAVQDQCTGRTEGVRLTWKPCLTAWMR